MVTEASKEYIGHFFRSKQLAAIHASPLFPPGKMPSKLADAFVVIQSEEVRVSNAVTEQEILEANRR